MVPPLSQADDLPSIRRRFAEAVREEMEERKKARKILTYDDVLIRLRETLFDEQRGPAACDRLRERYDVVLVDEFQDTDPVQWDIMHRAFGEGGATLVLIGDPKQAIYAFRGADVHAYLQARDEVQSEWTLDVNWRSDQGLLEAYDALFGDAQLGYAGIAYRRIRAAEANQQQRLVGCPVDAPLRVRIVHADDGLVPLTAQRQLPKAAEARSFIARDLAADVVRLLTDAPELITRSREGVELGRTTVHPGHLAVLVRTNSQAVTVRDALRAAGVPAVIGGSGSVFATEPALEWLRLLEALERPTARDRASLAALTCFVGWTPEEVATADEAEWEGLHWSLHRWATLLRDQGVASLYQAVSSSHEVPERVLARPSGERFMTDLRHIAQLLHEAGVSEGLGPTAMATWLGRRIHDAARDGENEERARRLESDAEAVQVITIHRSKGLEFPIVFCPYMWDGRPFGKDDHVPMFHDPDHANVRTIDVGRDGNAFALHQKMELEEARGEDLRLLYVALTRARHQAILWWAGAQDSQHSPLARLLFDRDAQGVVGPYGAKTRSDAAVESTLGGLGPCVSVERVDEPTAARWEEGAGNVPDLEAAVFDRTLDIGWRRASYSSITSSLARPAGRRERAGATADVRRGCAPGAAGTDSSGSSSHATVRFRCSWPACRGVHSWARSSTGCSSTWRSRHPTCMPSCRARWPRRWRGATSTSAVRPMSSPACAPPLRPPSGRWWTTSGCATSRGRTVSTSSPSRSPWSAVTHPPPPSTSPPWPTSSRSISRRMIRWRAMPRRCATPRWVGSCGGT